VPQHQAVRRLFHQLLASLPAGSGLPPFYPIGAPAAASGGLGGAEPVPPHISLSRTVPVEQSRTRPLMASLERRLRGAAPRPRSGGLRLRGVRAFVNDEGTRTFAALCVEEGAAEVCALVRAVDAAFEEHGLSPFYEVSWREHTFLGGR
jgi:hypothetical protein